MRRRLGMVVVACLIALVAPATAASAGYPALLTGVRASHQPGFDRVVFDFYGGLPSSTPDTGYVGGPALIGDPSGRPVYVAGRYILQLTMRGARGHTENGTDTSPNRTAFALPNVLTVVQSGDSEGVVTYGIGVASRQSFRLFTLSDPPRVVVDIATDFSWSNRSVVFYDSNGDPRSVQRPIITSAPAHGLMDRLFAGPTDAEKAAGLRFVSSRAKFYSNLTVNSDGVAEIRLRGGCSSGGSTATIAGEIFPTLKQLATVDHVKIYDYYYDTENPSGTGDSIPECLEP